MIDWKSILINGFITLIVVFVGIRLFVPERPFSVDKIQSSPKVRESKMETSSSQQKVDQIPHPDYSAALAENFHALNKSLQVIADRLALIEKKIDNNTTRTTPRTLPPIPNVIQDERRAMFPEKNPTAWIEELEDEERKEVQKIFREHAKRIRQGLAASSVDGRPDPTRMRQIMKESDKQLKEDLKAALSEEDYQRYLDSLPKPLAMPPPPLPDNR
jgi:hypothetical protein